MNVFRVSREMVLDVVGFAQESPDETVVSSVNVRLDEMFREATRNIKNVIMVHGDDLQKIIENAPHGLNANPVTFQTRKLEFNGEDLNIDQIVQELNAGPRTLAVKLNSLSGLVVCHSPMFWFKKTAKRVEVRIWLRCVVISAAVA